MTPLPMGFATGSRSSPFLDLVGPVAQRTEPYGTISVGLWAEPKHTNHRGLVHGAVLTALADIALGRSAAAVGIAGTHWVTTSLTVDYIAPGHAGTWLEAAATVQRAGRRLAFTRGVITSDGTVIAQTTALFSAI